MNLDDFTDFQWLEPWRSSPSGLEVELERECSSAHPLSGHKAISVGRRDDRDDVLFFLPDHALPLAVVHLTWSGKREAHPGWPQTIFYSSLDDWVERCMKREQLEFAGRSEASLI
ncbi:MAG: hypothetical protein JO360_14030 [Acidobacteria bacterium]|nr:hypothetical protein [Acidobacteriota bacterium]